MNTTTTSESREELWELIKDIKFGMFTSRHGNGHLHSRPMTTQNKQIDEDDRLYFFMSRRGDPVDDLAAEPNVNVSYSDPASHRFVSVTGMAAVVNDPAKTRALWTRMADAWFPGGMDDPDLALVVVTIDHAHYWDMKDSRLVQMFKLAKAAVTGKPPAALGDSKEVRMR